MILKMDDVNSLAGKSIKFCSFFLPFLENTATRAFNFFILFSHNYLTRSFSN